MHVPNAVAVIIVALGLAACAPRTRALDVAPSSSKPVAGLQPLILRPCTVAGVAEQVQCGAHEVYEDRHGRSGRRISLNVVVLPARTSPAAPDPLFVLAGGPGEAATNMAAFMASEFPALREHRDVVLVDQRGTGQSNRLQCDLGSLDARLHAVMTMDVRTDAIRACRTSLEEHADLRFYTTPLAMDDLDDVRAALGYERINLYGGSYGTRAAFVYMRQHPARVRSVVMRAIAPVDMRAVLPAARHGQRALDGLIAACGGDPACARAYPRIAADLSAVLTRLGEAPIEVPVPAASANRDTIRVTRDLFAGALPFLLADPQGASIVPLLIHRAHEGDFTPFIAAVSPVATGYTRFLSLGMALSVLCAEDGAAIDAASISQETAGTFLGEHRVRNQLAACREWPRGAIPVGYYEPVASRVPVLMISGEHDPIDGLDLAERAVRLLPNAMHVIIPGGTHQPQFPGCLRDLMQEFVARGSAAGLDAACVAEIRRPPFAH